MASSITRNKRDGSTQNDNFRWISAGRTGIFITLDRQQRLYLSSDARRETMITRGEKIVVGYDKANQRLVLAKAEVVRVPNVRPWTVSHDHYIFARKIIEEIGVDPADLPVRFEFVGRDFSEYDRGSFAFERVDED
jgi:hypothetical protein